MDLEPEPSADKAAYDEHSTPGNAAVPGSYEAVRNPKREPDHLAWIAVKNGDVVASAASRTALLGWLRRSDVRGAFVERRQAAV